MNLEEDKNTNSMYIQTFESWLNEKSAMDTEVPWATAETKKILDKGYIEKLKNEEND
jgi:hypothetical protein